MRLGKCCCKHCNNNGIRLIFIENLLLQGGICEECSSLLYAYRKYIGHKPATGLCVIDDQLVIPVCDNNEGDT